jgi:hypothetical protein
MAKTPQQNRVRILEIVKTPLAFFTLGMLIVELILGALSARATDMNLTILIAGMVAAFFMLCAMVFVLALRPELRHALLGNVEPSLFSYIENMRLTKNDIRVLYAFSTQPSLFHGFNNSVSTYLDGLLIGANPGSFEARINKFKKLRFLKSTSYGYSITDEGTDVANLVAKFSEPVLDLKREGRI